MHSEIQHIYTHSYMQPSRRRYTFCHAHTHSYLCGICVEIMNGPSRLSLLSSSSHVDHEMSNCRVTIDSRQFSPLFQSLIGGFIPFEQKVQ